MSHHGLPVFPSAQPGGVCPPEDADDGRQDDSPATPAWVHMLTWGLMLALVGLLGYIIRENWSTPVEDALEARLRWQGLAEHIQGIDCAERTAAATACQVRFVSGTGLAPAVVSVPVAALPFPSAFHVYRRFGRNTQTVRTSYDGKALPVEEGARALQASVNAATDAAHRQLGPQLAAGLNALTYEQGVKVAPVPAQGANRNAGQAP